MGLLWFNLIMLAFYLPSLILHEYGHAFAARLVGLRLQSISIGKGESFLQIGHFSLARKQFWEGLHRSQPSEISLSRGQRAVVLLGGVGANLTGGVFVLILSLLFPSPIMHLLAQPFIQVSLIFIVFNLLPIRLSSGIASDGLQLKQLFFNKNQHTS
ncbi:conserved hypothetical protein [Exiguobacterium sibiricum 255-15]|uniref:Peptidase M50 domain-containing protein n=1 Tax=Exiguobacterium sibiricum (strain DSM 17290 / CCUG 55495 / CIP 109462 / JCM 13490 / 255-15) TaxID=262543 RepID=B1YGI2_EXIS2|nr:site-2 protease family protein [Exiguobacterium sibiricum]ACB60986.1 conserved hypothetical protein [Exiguobacterium sibiricum 255-15]